MKKTKGKEDNINKLESQLFRKYLKCALGKHCERSCPNHRRQAKPLVLSATQKKQKKKDIMKCGKCRVTCHKKYKKEIKALKNTRKKAYSARTKERQKKCCKCHYIKRKGKLYKVKGPYGSCSYGMDNCCKDKKTIVKLKKKKKKKAK